MAEQPVDVELTIESLLHRTNSDTDMLIGRTIDDRYRLISLIAEGGMGRVYKAEQVNLGRPMALKVLTPHSFNRQHDPHFRERFAREAATASQLSSPHTVTVFDHGKTADGIFYIAMEYVDGITLSQLMRGERRLSPERAASIARQICISLREAHARNIVHRDIKPANILIIQQGYEFVKVVDFGIAKMIEADASPDANARALTELTQLGTYVGTPEYMAPECFSGRVDPRADIYAVGVLLYLMVSGRLPFKGSSAPDTIMMVLHEPPPPLELGSGRGLEFEAVILRCLSKRPADRFQTIDALLSALTDALQVSELDPHTQSRAHPDPELEPDLLSPLTTAGQHAPLTGLPRWFAHRKQQLAFAASMLTVLLLGLLVLISKGEPDGAQSAPAPGSMALPLTVPSTLPLDEPGAPVAGASEADPANPSTGLEPEIKAGSAPAAGVVAGGAAAPAGAAESAGQARTSSEAASPAAGRGQKSGRSTPRESRRAAPAGNTRPSEGSPDEASDGAPAGPSRLDGYKASPY